MGQLVNKQKNEIKQQMTNEMKIRNFFLLFAEIIKLAIAKN